MHSNITTVTKLKELHSFETEWQTILQTFIVKSIIGNVEIKKQKKTTNENHEKQKERENPTPDTARNVKAQNNRLVHTQHELQ